MLRGAPSTIRKDPAFVSGSFGARSRPQPVLRRLRRELTPPQPDRERAGAAPNPGVIWPRNSARSEYGTIVPGGAEQFVAHR